MTEAKADTLAACIETIEGGYEFMLAYAAQGRMEEKSGDGPSIRQTLAAMSEAIAQLDAAARQRVSAAADDRAYGAFLEILAADAEKANAVIAVALAGDNITSPLVDNLNASAHIRTLLTDLFVIDEAL